MDSDIQTSLGGGDGGESIFMQLAAEAGGDITLLLIDLEGEGRHFVMSVDEIEAW